MEIKINKEVRNFKKTIFFGLTTRQAVWGSLSIMLAVVIYFFLFDKINKYLLMLIILLACSPLAFIAFVEWNGMKGEDIIKVVVINLMTSPYLRFVGKNYWYELLVISADENSCREKKNRFAKNKEKEEWENEEEQREG